MPVTIRSVLGAMVLAVSLAVGYGQTSQGGVGVASAGDSAAGCCPAPKLQPFVGHVFDDATGQPIAGAKVIYLDDNPPVDRNDKPVRGITSGSVVTAADGGFALPTDLPLATYHIRVESPGYYAATIYDSQRIAGEREDSRFHRPSHDIRLKPSHELVAIGASRLDGVEDGPSYESVTAAAFAPGGGSIVIAGRGPALWLVTLGDDMVHPITLPASIISSDQVISSIGWDGKTLMFVATRPPKPNGQPGESLIGGASSPDFNVTFLPVPERMTMNSGQVDQNLDGFTFEQTSECEQGNWYRHCQGGSIVAHNKETGKAITVFSASAGDLSYQHDPMLGGLVAFAEETASHDIPAQQRNSGNMEVPGLTLLNLVTHQRSHIELPGAWERHPTLVAERMVPATGVWAMRLAYTTEGDCDPGTTSKAQPSAPEGMSGFTPNNWSVCVVTIPVPPPPKPVTAAHRAAGHTR